ncbi:MAG: hypothetical protein WBW16_13195 [Bacteroidota bacterium]
MIRNLVVCSTLLFLTGCDIFPRAVGPTTTESDLIIRGFDETDTVTVGREGIRVGGYYDFSAYDSLRINFSAKRLSLSPAFDHIQIIVGVACRLSDSLSAVQKDISLLVKPPGIVKPYCVGLTFIVPDTGVRLLLSQLRVIGWPAQ